MINIIVFITIISLFLYIVRRKNNNLGYLYGHSNQYVRQSAEKYKYSLKKYLDGPSGSSRCIASNGDEIVGSLTLIPWKITGISNMLYIGNDLEVSAYHRNRGVANQIVLKSVNKLVSNGGFGIFSTNKELSVETHVYTLYWTKKKCILSNSSLLLKPINIDELSYNKYPAHQWLNVPIQNRKMYFKYLEKKGMKILGSPNHEIIVGAESIFDASGDFVSHVKWYWGSDENLNKAMYSLCEYFGNEYFSFPTINKPNEIWDKSISYIYAKPKNVYLPPLSRLDINGWYLDR
tara:strand:+ start:478 stop:1350 length:873 start_codon:yes stop_codon:yes gene_type:complete